MGLKRADAERAAVAVNIVSAAVWSLGKLDYRLCSWLERACWFPVLSGSAGRKQASGQNEFGREESVFRLRSIRIRRRAAVSPSACKPNCRPLPESKPLPSRMLLRCLEILRERHSRARTRTRSRSIACHLGRLEVLRAAI